MRWMLRILGWMGLGLSTVLFVGTVVLWVRSMGHEERWTFRSFQENPEWTQDPSAPRGAFRIRSIRAVHAHIWLSTYCRAPSPLEQSNTEHSRDTIAADRAQQGFDVVFTPGRRLSVAVKYWAWNFAGIGFRHQYSDLARQTGRPEFDEHTLAIPFWMLAVVFGLWPVCSVARRVFRRRRHGAGLCPHCGYDLRATPDRCPECGRAVDAGRGSRENA